MTPKPNPAPVVTDHQRAIDCLRDAAHCLTTDDEEYQDHDLAAQYIVAAEALAIATAREAGEERLQRARSTLQTMRETKAGLSEDASRVAQDMFGMDLYFEGQRDCLDVWIDSLAEALEAP